MINHEIPKFKKQFYFGHVRLSMSCEKLCMLLDKPISSIYYFVSLTSSVSDLKSVTFFCLKEKKIEKLYLSHISYGYHIVTGEYTF